MSIHYSKFDLNTYKGSDYFLANIPSEYPIEQVLEKCRAFRRLPPNLRRLSELSKTWCRKQSQSTDINEIDAWYDDEGYELDINTGKRLTDEEIDNQWRGSDLSDFEIDDIPIPDGGFPDPNTWETPSPKEDPDTDDDGITAEQLLKDIKSHGREYVAKEYGVSAKSNFSDKGLARAILAKMGRRSS